MDYQAFYNDVVEWINRVNQMAIKYGMHSEQFWSWVADSCGALCKKYHDHQLVKKQMTMLIHWLEDVYESQNRKGENT